MERVGGASDRTNERVLILESVFEVFIFKLLKRKTHFLLLNQSYVCHHKQSCTYMHSGIEWLSSLLVSPCFPPLESLNCSCITTILLYFPVSKNVHLWVCVYFKCFWRENLFWELGVNMTWKRKWESSVLDVFFDQDRICLMSVYHLFKKGKKGKIF